MWVLNTGVLARGSEPVEFFTGSFIAFDSLECWEQLGGNLVEARDCPECEKNQLTRPDPSNVLPTPPRGTGSFHIHYHPQTPCLQAPTSLSSPLFYHPELLFGRTSLTRNSGRYTSPAFHTDRYPPPVNLPNDNALPFPSTPLN